MALTSIWVFNIDALSAVVSCNRITQTISLHGMVTLFVAMNMIFICTITTRNICIVTQQSLGSSVSVATTVHLIEGYVRTSKHLRSSYHWIIGCGALWNINTFNDDHTLKRKCHLYEIFITGCTGSFGASSDEYFAKMATFPFQCTHDHPNMFCRLKASCYICGINFISYIATASQINFEHAPIAAVLSRCAH